MRGFSWGCYVVAFGGLVAALVAVVLNANKVSIVSFMIATFSLLTAILYETSQARQLSRSTDERSEKTKDELLKTFGDSFTTISTQFGIYPSLILMGGKRHYEILAKYVETLKNEKYSELYGKILRYFCDIADESLNSAVSNYYILEDNFGRFHDFINIFWESVSKNGRINATSIVDPAGFWEGARAIAYLNRQKNLIKQRGAHIYRYFIIAHNHINRLNAHNTVIKENLRRDIKVRIILLKNKESPVYKDMGLVDLSMAVENEVDSETENIIESKCHILGPNKENESNIGEISDLFDNLEENPGTIRLEDVLNELSIQSQEIETKYEELFQKITEKAQEIIGGFSYVQS